MNYQTDDKHLSKVTKNANKRKNNINFKNNRSTAQLVWCNFNQSWLKMFNVTFLSKCADRKLKILDKSIAGDPYQLYFRLALFIQWSVAIIVYLKYFCINAFKSHIKHIIWFIYHLFSLYNKWNCKYFV